MSNKNKVHVNIRDTKNRTEKIDDMLSENENTDEAANESQKLTDEIESLKDKLLRKAAEFDNYKKRTDSEISNYIKYASENLIKELIPVYDDLRRSIDSIDKGETKDFETLKKGVSLIYEKFKNILEKEGLTDINSQGKEFDVNVNSALMQIPRDDVKPNTVLDIIERGYKLKDKVVKHEKVFVSSEPDKN